VPALGYTTSDQPFPRGELWVKTARLRRQAAQPCYFGSEQPLVDEQGYFHTGDIVELRPGHQIRVIDRCKNTYKLSQSEFVAPELLENLLETHLEWIDLAFLLCHQAQCLVLVVSPRPGPFRRLLLAAAPTLATVWPVESTTVPAALATRPEVAEIMREHVVDVLSMHQRPTYEFPRLCLLFPEEFTPANGFLVVAGKKNRPRLIAHFGPLAAQLLPHASPPPPLPPARLTTAAVLSMPLPELQQAVVELLQQVMPSASTHDFNLIQGGADSLTLTQLHTLLRRRFDHELVPSIQAILRTPTAAGISAALQAQAQRMPGTAAPPAAADPAIAEDLAAVQSAAFAATMAGPTHHRRPGAFEMGALLTGLPSLPATVEARTVLVTGATGFLGRYLLSQLLTQATPPRVVCLVRGSSDAEAMSRVEAALLQAKLPAAPPALLQVYAADLRQADFGLGAARYEQLATEVDVVYHLASRVNHMVPYALLREDNVVATRQLLTFCVAGGRRKIMHYASTLGVHTNHDSVMASNSGYLISKYVAEQYVQRAQALGLRCSIHRFGAIGFALSTGYFNQADFICQTIGAVLHSQLPPPPEALQKDIYLLPVDVAARQMHRLSEWIERHEEVGPLHLTGQVPLNWAALMDLAAAAQLPAWLGVPATSETGVWVDEMLQRCSLLSFKLEHRRLPPRQILPERPRFSCPVTEQLLTTIGEPYELPLPEEAVFRFLSQFSADLPSA
jgi:fatty acid CoA ligase FadD9